MNCIEEYHQAGVIELLRTSTLDTEFLNAPLQKQKANKYMSIGGRAVSLGSETWDSMAGAVSNKSKFYEYFKKIFPNEQSEESRTRSLRDCLHIDQAVLNNCDYFVTQEKKLIEAGISIDELKREIRIVCPSQCLEELKEYFERCNQTSDPQKLKSKLLSEGSVMLGSNSSLYLQVKDPSDGSTLLSYYVKDNNLIIECNIFDSEGTQSVVIKYGEPIKVLIKDVYIKTLGTGPLLIGERKVNQIYIGTEDVVFLSVRAISSGRAIFDQVNLHSRDALRSFVVDRELLKIKGLKLCSLKNET